MADQIDDGGFRGLCAPGILPMALSPALNLVESNIGVRARCFCLHYQMSSAGFVHGALGRIVAYGSMQGGLGPGTSPSTTSSLIDLYPPYYVNLGPFQSQIPCARTRQTWKPGSPRLTPRFDRAPVVLTRIDTQSHNPHRLPPPRETATPT